MAIVNELVTKFSFLGNLKPQESFNANLKLSIGLLAGVAGAVGGATLAFGALVSAQLNVIGGLNEIKDVTGVSIVEIERLGYITTAAGESVDDLYQSLKSMTRIAGDAARNGSDTFDELGISVRNANGEVKNANVIIEDLRKSFERMNLSSAERASYARALRIDPALIKVLSLSTQEYEKFNQQAKNSLSLTDEQADAADEYNDSLGLLNLSLRNVRNQIAVNFAPTMAKLSNGFIQLLNDNQDWIIRGIKTTGEVLGNLADLIVRVTPFILGIGAAFAVARIASVGFAVVMGTILSPVVLITAAIVGAILILDDLIVAFKGGKSVIRDFLIEWAGIDITPKLQEFVAAIGPALTELWELFKLASDIYAGIGKVFAVRLTGGGWLEELQAIKNEFILIGNFLDKFVGHVLNVGSAISSILPESLGGGSMVVPPSQSLNNGGKTVIQNNEIKVSSSDPERAGRITADRLQDQLGNADALNYRGGM